MVRERPVGEVLHLGPIAPTRTAEVEQVAPARAPEAVHGHDVRERHDRQRRDGKERRSGPHAEEPRSDTQVSAAAASRRQGGPRGSEQSRLVGSLPAQSDGDGREPDEKRDVRCVRDTGVLLGTYEWLGVASLGLLGIDNETGARVHDPSACSLVRSDDALRCGRARDARRRATAQISPAASRRDTGRWPVSLSMTVFIRSGLRP